MKLDPKVKAACRGETVVFNFPQDKPLVLQYADAMDSIGQKDASDFLRRICVITKGDWVQPGWKKGEIPPVEKLGR